jgi:hypothetical protein
MTEFKELADGVQLQEKAVSHVEAGGALGSFLEQKDSSATPEFLEVQR